MKRIEPSIFGAFCELFVAGTCLAIKTPEMRLSRNAKFVIHGAAYTHKVFNATGKVEVRVLALRVRWKCWQANTSPSAEAQKASGGMEMSALDGSCAECDDLSQYDDLLGAVIRLAFLRGVRLPLAPDKSLSVEPARS